MGNGCNFGCSQAPWWRRSAPDFAVWVQLQLGPDWASDTMWCSSNTVGYLGQDTLRDPQRTDRAHVHCALWFWSVMTGGDPLQLQRKANAELPYTFPHLLPILLPVKRSLPWRDCSGLLGNGQNYILTPLQLPSDLQTPGLQLLC